MVFIDLTQNEITYKEKAVLMNKNDKVIDVGTAESYLDTFRL